MMVISIMVLEAALALDSLDGRWNKVAVRRSQKGGVLIEMGLHAKSDKMHVICEKGFYRYDNVRITCEYYGVPLYNDLESFLKSLATTS